MEEKGSRPSEVIKALGLVFGDIGTLVEVEKIMKQAGIDESTIFYGIEDIVTGNPVWRVFSMIKRLTPAFVQFYKLRSN